MLLQNRFILREPSVTIFDDINENVAMFTKAILKDSKNLEIERIINYASK